MRILVTGGTGFLGSHLVERLAASGHEVTATHFPQQASRHALALSPVKVAPLDVRAAQDVEALLARLRPDRIYHLAAQSFPALSWEKPAETMITNAGGTIHVFEAIRKLRLETRILVACSSGEYGFVREEDLPTKETHPLLPLHPYGVSKVAQDLLAYQYWRNFGSPCVRARIFNTTGPGKTGDAAADFVGRVVAAERQGGGVVTVGNLEARRDLSDARDACRALELVLEQGKLGDVYNVCSGHALRIGDLLDLVIKESPVKLTVKQDPALLRPTDEPVILGDPGKIRRELGYAPEIPVAKTAADMLAFERARTA